MTETATVTESAKQAIAGLIEKLRQAGDFAIEQAPDVIRQMVAYEATMAWCGVAAGLLSAGAFVYVCRRHGPPLHSFFCSGGEGESPIGILSIPAAGIAAVVLICTNLPTAIQTTFFPKWFIVSRLAEILK